MVEPITKRSLVSSLRCLIGADEYWCKRAYVEIAERNVLFLKFSTGKIPDFQWGAPTVNLKFLAKVKDHLEARGYHILCEVADTHILIEAIQ